MIDLFGDTGLSLNFVFSLMIKIMMGLIVVVSFLMVRQASLMDKVVDVPIGRGFVMIAWLFALVCLVLTGIVIIAG